MALFKRKDMNLLLFLISLLYGVPMITAINIDCNGKSFHCVNSTHFMICVDVGGSVSMTIDSFIMRCPSTTFCQSSNNFECEYRASTTQIFQESDVTNELTETRTTTSVYENGIHTTLLPHHEKTSALPLQKYFSSMTSNMLLEDNTVIDMSEKLKYTTVKNEEQEKTFNNVINNDRNYELEYEIDTKKSIVNKSEFAFPETGYKFEPFENNTLGVTEQTFHLPTEGTAVSDFFSQSITTETFPSTGTEIIDVVNVETPLILPQNSAYSNMSDTLSIVHNKINDNIQNLSTSNSFDNLEIISNLTADRVFQEKLKVVNFSDSLTLSENTNNIFEGKNKSLINNFPNKTITIHVEDSVNQNIAKELTFNLTEFVDRRTRNLDLNAFNKSVILQNNKEEDILTATEAYVMNTVINNTAIHDVTTDNEVLLDITPKINQSLEQKLSFYDALTTENMILYPTKTNIAIKQDNATVLNIIPEGEVLFNSTEKSYDFVTESFPLLKQNILTTLINNEPHRFEDITKFQHSNSLSDVIDTSLLSRPLDLVSTERTNYDDGYLSSLTKYNNQERNVIVTYSKTNKITTDLFTESTDINVDSGINKGDVITTLTPNVGNISNSNEKKYIKQKEQLKSDKIFRNLNEPYETDNFTQSMIENSNTINMTKEIYSLTEDENQGNPNELTFRFKKYFTQSFIDTSTSMISVTQENIIKVEGNNSNMQENKAALEVNIIDRTDILNNNMSTVVEDFTQSTPEISTFMSTPHIYPTEPKNRDNPNKITFSVAKVFTQPYDETSVSMINELPESNTNAEENNLNDGMYNVTKNFTQHILETSIYEINVKDKKYIASEYKDPKYPKEIMKNDDKNFTQQPIEISTLIINNTQGNYVSVEADLNESTSILNDSVFPVEGNYTSPTLEKSTFINATENNIYRTENNNQDMLNEITFNVVNNFTESAIETSTLFKNKVEKNKLAKEKENIEMLDDGIFNIIENFAQHTTGRSIFINNEKQENYSLGNGHRQQVSHDVTNNIKQNYPLETSLSTINFAEVVNMTTDAEDRGKHNEIIFNFTEPTTLIAAYTNNEPQKEDNRENQGKFHNNDIRAASDFSAVTTTTMNTDVTTILAALSSEFADTSFHAVPNHLRSTFDYNDNKTSPAPVNTKIKSNEALPNSGIRHLIQSNEYAMSTTTENANNLISQPDYLNMTTVRSTNTIHNANEKVKLRNSTILLQFNVTITELAKEQKENISDFIQHENKLNTLSNTSCNECNYTNVLYLKQTVKDEINTKIRNKNELSIQNFTIGTTSLTKQKKRRY